MGVWACVSVRVRETEQSEILKYFHLFCCLVASELQEKCLHKNRPASVTPISHSPKFQRSCILRSFDNQAKNEGNKIREWAFLSTFGTREGKNLGLMEKKLRHTYPCREPAWQHIS